MNSNNSGPESWHSILASNSEYLPAIITGGSSVVSAGVATIGEVVGSELIRHDWTGASVGLGVVALSLWGIGGKMRRDNS